MEHLQFIVSFIFKYIRSPFIRTPTGKPVITESPVDDREVLVGNGPLTFTCVSLGTPEPSIEWYFSGQPIAPRSGVSTVGNTLTIATPQTSNFGVYQCIVNNLFGDDQHAWLLEIRPASEPQIFDHVW